MGALVKIRNSCGCLKLKSQTVDLGQLWVMTQGGGGGKIMSMLLDIFVGRANFIMKVVYLDVVRRVLSE